MTQIADIQTFIDLTRTCQDLDQLSVVLNDITIELGFDFFALVQHVDVRKSINKDAVWIGTYPQAWIEVFEKRGYVSSDPIHVASQRTHTGFQWGELQKLLHLTAHHKRILQAAKQEGLGNGFTVPTHLPGDSNGSCSFAMKRSKALQESSLAAAQIVGLYSMEAGRRIVISKQRKKEPAQLSPRQLECVVLAARGKTDWEIAKILGIKETTVRDYVGEACSRYDVRKRMQLVMRALHDGHLSLRDAIG